MKIKCPFYIVFQVLKVLPIRTWSKMLDVMLTFDKSQKSYFMELFGCKVK